MFGILEITWVIRDKIEQTKPGILKNIPYRLASIKILQHSLAHFLFYIDIRRDKQVFFILVIDINRSRGYIRLFGNFRSRSGGKTHLIDKLHRGLDYCVLLAFIFVSHAYKINDQSFNVKYFIIFVLLQKNPPYSHYKIFVAIIRHLWHIITMKWEDLLEIVGREPIFHSSVLLAGEADPVDIGRQLSRWVKSGNLIQLRRSLYVLSERYQKTRPHPFHIANRVKRASYVSLQSALEYHNLIPEYVPSVTSITTGRPEELLTPLGTFIFKHIRKTLFAGYQSIDLGEDQTAFIATPEKALLDLLYLTPGSDNPNYLRELRLQNSETLNTDLLIELSDRSGSKKLQRAARRIMILMPELEAS